MPTEIIDNLSTFASRKTETPSTPDIYRPEATYGVPYPIMDRLLIIQSQSKETVYAGTHIYIPETAQRDPHKGTVVSISPALKEFGIPVQGVFMPLNIKEGDVVTFTQYTDERFTVGNDTYLLLRVHDIKFVEPVAYVVNA